MQEATLTLYGYCGMSDPIVTRDERQEIETVRRLVARILRRRRADGFPVAMLDRGSRWEITEPEDSVLVPDGAGILRLSVVNRCDYCSHILNDDEEFICCESAAEFIYGIECEETED